jgi:hypothetical protein
MLRLDGELFTEGRSHFFDQAPGGERGSKIFVRVSFHGLNLSQIAQLDTGSAWSVLDPETADQLGVLQNGTGEVIRLDTRLGRFQGRLERIPFVLLADEGNSLEVEGTFFVCGEWPGQIFLGYNGLLERIRLAIDPATNHFYFGSSEGRP